MTGMFCVPVGGSYRLRSQGTSARSVMRPMNRAADLALGGGQAGADVADITARASASLGLAWPPTGGRCITIVERSGPRQFTGGDCCVISVCSSAIL